MHRVRAHIRGLLVAGIAVFGWGCPPAFDIDTTNFSLTASGAGGNAAAGSGASAGTAGAAGAMAPPGVLLVNGTVFDARDGKTALTGDVSATSERWSAPISAKLAAGAFEIRGTKQQAAEKLDMVITVSAKGFQPRKFAYMQLTAGESNVLPALYLCADADAAKHDTDHDGICDQAEKLYGTDPMKADSDADALSDVAELFGEFDSGTMYSIRAYGANPMHRDIFLELDSMAGRAPKKADVDLVVAAFKKAPGSNPDKLPGITLHAYLDPELPTEATKEVLKTYGDVDTIRSKYSDKRRRSSFHYGLFAHTFESSPGSSGLSLDTGATFLVTLNDLPDSISRDEAMPGTIMHELGHDLGLVHSGFVRRADGTLEGDNVHNYRPHYFSIMSYNYQMTPFMLDGVKVLDYARVDVAGFSESKLDEEAAFAPKPGSNTTKAELARYTNLRQCLSQKDDELSAAMVGAKPKELGNASKDLDLNLNGKIDRGTTTAGVYKPHVFARDIDGDGKITDFEALVDDWSNLKFDAFHGPVVSPDTNLRLVTDAVICTGPRVVDR